MPPHAAIGSCTPSFAPHTNTFAAARLSAGTDGNSRLADRTSESVPCLAIPSVSLHPNRTPELSDFGPIQQFVMDSAHPEPNESKDGQEEGWHVSRLFDCILL